MTETPAPQSFPRRDKAGRVLSMAELMVFSLGGIAIGLVALTLVEGVIWLIGAGSFGRASGWVALIPPGLVFFEDLRAWRGYGVRFLVALIAAGVAVGIGLLVAGLISGLPAMVSGGVGAAVAAVLYALIWFVGIHWLTGQDAGMEAR